MPTDDYSLVTVAALVAVMVVRAGLAAYATGLTRSKHAASTVTRSLLDICFTSLAFWLVATVFMERPAGAGVASSDGAWAAIPLPMTVVGTLLPVVILAGGILSGVLAERCGFWATMLAATALGAVVMPPPLLWSAAGTGWLAKLGAAGPTVAFPIAGAAFALVGARMVGARANKYHRDGSTSLIPGHSLPLATLGAFLALVGLISFGGIMTGRGDGFLLAVAGGGVASAIVTQVRLGKLDLGLILTGLLGAAVASLSAGIVRPWEAVVVGVGAGLLVPHVAFLADMQWKTDDPIAGVSIYGVGGAWGLLAGGMLFHGTIMERLKLIGANALTIVVVAAWAAGVGLVVFTLIKRVVRLRVKEADEFDGLDLAEHDVAAYPDFQQNTIRSFHMREA